MIDTNAPVVEFTAQDRCDRCGAQAFVSYNKGWYELLFCLHHSKKHNVSLEADGWVAAYDFKAIESFVDNEPVTA